MLQSNLVCLKEPQSKSKTELILKIVVNPLMSAATK